MWGPHQSPIYFAWINFNNSIMRNYEVWSFAYFKTFFRIKENSKVACWKENWQPILLKKKTEFLEPKKKMLRVKMGELKSGNLFEGCYLARKTLLKLKMVNLKVTRGLEWPFRPYKGGYRLSLRKKAISWVQLCWKSSIDVGNTLI